MRRGATLLLILLLFFSAVCITAQATVLPSNTSISTPDGKTFVLTSDEFLLTRSAMEQATEALADKAIDEKTIADLKALANDLQKKLDNRFFIDLIIGGASALGGGLIGHSVK